MHGLSFAKAALGPEHYRGGDLPRHRHAEGYMTLVLAGGYLEAGDAGRFRVVAGDVLIHRPFEAHCDFFGRTTAQLLNLPLPRNAPDAPRVRLADPDPIVRLAEKDLAAAAEALCFDVVPAQAEQDWPDLLAEALRRPGRMRLAEWAASHGLAPATVSRGFQKAFSTTPARFRAEARTRLAWHAIAMGRSPLADLAYDLGFADQAHMTRSLVSLTGRPPRGWRTEVKSIQDHPGGRS
jgi:AraC-like DNA-binding protein